MEAPGARGTLVPWHLPSSIYARVALMCLGIPAQLVAVSGAGLATAEISGVRREVSTALVPEAEVGDWVLIHVGFALHTIDEEEAARTLELLEEIEW